MNERVVTMQQLRFHAVEAKREIETVMDILGWPKTRCWGARSIG